MDLTQLANLGEFIGGVAVLVTLVYPAIQVRRGTAAQQSAAAVTAGEAICFEESAPGGWSDATGIQRELRLRSKACSR